MKWKPIIIDGYETSYEARADGKIRHINTKHIKATHYNNDGYEMVNIYYNHEWHLIGVHRIIAMVFMPIDNPNLEVNHIDGIKHHNSIDNLEWVTRTENMQHAYKTGLNVNHKGLNARHRVYPKAAIIAVIKALMDNPTNMSKIARNTGIPVDTVFLIKTGRRYADISKDMGYEPIPAQPRYDFSPYHDDIERMVRAGCTSKEIRDTIHIPINAMMYNHYIRKVRKSLTT